MKKKVLKLLLFVSMVLAGMYCEKQNSRSDMISQASEDYLSKVDGTKPGELDSLLLSGVASYGDSRKALAVRYFEKAYELGDVRGAVKLYELYNSEKDEEKIKEWEVKAAEMGVASVQNNLGVRLLNEGKSKEAEKWYLKSAEQGNRSAQNNLGVLYKRGGNLKEAEKWYLKSAEQENRDAKYNLGELYENSLNDKEKAIYWYKQAADQGDVDSKKKLKELRGK